MRGKAGLAAALVMVLPLVAGACSSGHKCPKPVVYDDTTLKEIQKALTALPKDSILREVMTDYETERDELRFCE